MRRSSEGLPFRSGACYQAAMLRARLVVLGSAATVVASLALAVACGGSASETPFPLEPVGKASAPPERTVAAGGSSGMQLSQEPQPSSEAESEGSPDDSEDAETPSDSDAQAPPTWGATKR